MKYTLKKHATTLALAAAVTFTAAFSANAQLIAYDGFNYAPNTMWAVSGTGLSGGTGWGGITWSATATAIASNSAVGLTYGSLQTSAGGVVLGYPNGWPVSGGQTATIQRNLPQSMTNYFGGSGGTIWVSFLYQNWSTTGPINAQRQANFGLYASGTTNASGVSGVAGSERVDVGSVNSYTAGLADNMSLWGANPGPPMTLAQQSALATPRGNTTSPVLVVMRLDFTGSTATASPDAAYVWFNPTIGGVDPNTGTSISTNIFEFSNANGFRFNCGNLNASGTNAVMEVDELRIGYSFTDVTPVPEPVTFGLAGLGGLMLLALRRRR